MTRHAWHILMLAAASLGGCTASETVSMDLDNPAVLSETDAETAEEVARRVLRELRFEVVYPEASPGHLETRGLTGASWFEFWRLDTPADQRYESSFHTIRRRVSLSVSPREGGGSQVFVQVTKARLALASDDPSYIAQPFTLYRSDVRKTARPDPLEEATERGGVWVDQGRDGVLEQEILGRIAAAVHGAPAE